MSSNGVAPATIPVRTPGGGAYRSVIAAPPVSAPPRPVAGIVAVVVAVTAWGASGVLAKGVRDLDGLALAFNRLWIGAILTLVLFTLRGGRLNRRLLRTAVPGGLSFGADIVLFFTAIQLTTVANATIIGALQPALLLLVGWRLFGERATPADVGWTLLALVGVGAVVFGSSGSAAWSPIGDLVAAVSLVAWTAYFITSKQARRSLGALEYSTAITLVAAVAITPVALLSGQPLAIRSPGTWLVVVLLAIGPGGAAHLLLNWAHPHVAIVRTSLLTLAIPVVASGLAVVFLDEPLTLLQAAGGLVVIGSLAAVVLASLRPQVPLDQPAPSPASS